MPEQFPGSEPPASNLDAIVERFLQALLAGAKPNRADLVAQHPDIATELDKRLDAIERMHTAFNREDVPEGQTLSPRGASHLPETDRSTKTDRNLLFGALAFQNEYIDLAQFSAVCRAWAADKSRPLPDLLVERGWITAAVSAMLEDIVDRKLKRYGGDAHATLGAVADGPIRDAIREVNDSDISQSVSTLPPAAGHVLVETVSRPAGERTRYTLTRLHAQGGLGRVWLARDEDLNRDVALEGNQTRPGHSSRRLAAVHERGPDHRPA